VHGHLGLERLEQVPGDGLALAVLVGGEVELVRVLEQRLELGHLRPLVRRDDVEGLEVVVDVDAEPRPRLALVAGGDVGGVARQVADVADGAVDGVARPRKLAIFLALAGDSTITRRLPVALLDRPFAGAPVAASAVGVSVSGTALQGGAGAWAAAVVTASWPLSQRPGAPECAR
jgi:hypothetical protein